MDDDFLRDFIQERKHHFTRKDRKNKNQDKNQMVLDLEKSIDQSFFFRSKSNELQQ